MKPISLTARLALLFAAVSTAVLLATGWVLSRAVDAHFVEQDLVEIEGKIELVRHLLARVGSADDLDALPAQLEDALVGHEGVAVAVVDGAGRIWFASHLTVFPGDALALNAADPGPRVWEHEGRSFRALTRSLPTGLPDGEAVNVAVAHDITHHVVFMDFFSRVAWGFVLLASLTTAALGWVAARRGLAPLDAVTALATNVSATHLGERLSLAAVPAELHELVTVFNAMLDRLEDSFRRLSQFSTDIAHELRTPLNNLLVQTQVELAQARSVERYRDLLGSNIEEYERLARMVSDMLFIAKADNGLVVPRFETVDLAAETTRIAEFFEALAADRGVRIAVEGVAMTRGDRLMLDRAILNLVSNAVRHAAQGTTVNVSLATGAAATTIMVGNEGETIPPEHLPRLFDRFYRADPSRQDSAEGSGLGLAITRSIVAAHGGRIEVASANGRTRFTIRLPLS